MKPTYPTQCLLRICAWVSQVHYCIQTALEVRKRGTTALNAEWWLDRAKLHANAMRLMQAEYRASLPALATEN